MDCANFQAVSSTNKWEAMHHSRQAFAATACSCTGTACTLQALSCVHMQVGSYLLTCSNDTNYTADIQVLYQEACTQAATTSGDTQQQIQQSQLAAHAGNAHAVAAAPSGVLQVQLSLAVLSGLHERMQGVVDCCFVQLTPRMPILASHLAS